MTITRAAAWKMYLERGNDEPFYLNGVLVIPSKWGSSKDDNGLKSPQVKFLCSNPNCQGRLFGLFSARHYCVKEDNGVHTGSADEPPPPPPPPPPVAAAAAQKKKPSNSSDEKNPPKTQATKKKGGKAKKAAPKTKSAPKKNCKQSSTKTAGKKRGGGKKDDEGGTGDKVQRLATAAAADPELYAQYRAEMKAQRVVHQLSSDSNRRFSFPSYDVWKTLPRE